MKARTKATLAVVALWAIGAVVVGFFLAATGASIAMKVM
jgi:hypothetical protein